MEIDYGPLEALIGEWRGSNGMDVAPEPGGDEHNPFSERLIFEAAGDVTNAEEQTLSVLRYHQVVTRTADQKVFHDQVGYWMWDSATGVVMQSLSIPRGVTLLAGGSSRQEGGSTIIEVQAGQSDSDWQLSQSPFMQNKARTTNFEHRIEICGDQLSYSETTTVDIYGTKGYAHTDTNNLTRL
jgi:hypothetical protein